MSCLSSGTKANYRLACELLNKASKQLNTTIPTDDENAIEHVKTISLQASSFTMKNNKKTSICVHKKMHHLHVQYLIHANGAAWDFAQDNEMEWNTPINSFLAALDVKEEMLGENHVDAALALRGMAVVLDDVGEHEDSLNFCVRAKDVRIAALGCDHEGVSDTLRCMGNVHCVVEYFEDLSLKKETYGYQTGKNE